MAVPQCYLFIYLFLAIFWIRTVGTVVFIFSACHNFLDSLKIYVIIQSMHNYVTMLNYALASNDLTVSKLLWLFSVKVCGSDLLKNVFSTPLRRLNTSLGCSDATFMFSTTTAKYSFCHLQKDTTVHHLHREIVWRLQWLNFQYQVTSPHICLLISEHTDRSCAKRLFAALVGQVLTSPLATAASVVGTDIDGGHCTNNYCTNIQMTSF